MDSLYHGGTILSEDDDTMEVRVVVFVNERKQIQYSASFQNQ